MLRRALFLITALLFGLPLLACEEVESREDRRALMAVDKDFAERVEQQGFRVMEDFYDEDAIYMPAFASTVEGREKILDAYRPYYDNTTMKLSWTPMRAEVSRSRDLGWTIGTYVFTRIDDKGNTIVRPGRYITIWKKQRDGTWKAALDAGNPAENTPRPDDAKAE